MLPVAHQSILSLLQLTEISVYSKFKMAIHSIPCELAFMIGERLDGYSLVHFSNSCRDLHMLFNSTIKRRAVEIALGTASTYNLFPRLFSKNNKFPESITPLGAKLTGTTCVIAGTILF